MASPNRSIVLLGTTTITTAVTGTVTTAITGLAGVNYALFLAKFVYGSGGTSAKFWIQSSVDSASGSLTYFDIANFAFTTSSGTKLHKISTGTALTPATAISDAALTDNTILDGVLGDALRVKYTTTGTYAGSTTIAIYGVLKGNPR